MNKLKIVQIGVEHDHASQIMATLREMPEDFEVVGYYQAPDDDVTNCTPLSHAYDGLRRFGSLDEALSVPHLDAVAVETSEINTTRYALAVAERGLPMHMDKPGGTDPTDFDRLISTVKEKNLVFSTGYMYRYNPAVLHLLQMVRAGELGKITSVEAHMNCIHSDGKRAWLSRFPGGMFFFLGCHLIDLILQFNGRLPEAVVPCSHATGFRGVSAQDVGFALFRYPNGLSFAKTSASEFGGFMRRQLVVSGSDGTAVIEPLERSGEGGQYVDLRVVRNDSEGRKWGYDGERTTFGPFHRYRAMLERFARAVKTGEGLPVTPTYERQLYRVLLAACGAEPYRKPEKGEKPI